MEVELLKFSFNFYDKLNEKFNFHIDGFLNIKLSELISTLATPKIFSLPKYLKLRSTILVFGLQSIIIF